MQMAVFWVVAPCSLVDDAGSKQHRNVGKLIPDYTAQQRRRQPSSEMSPSVAAGWLALVLRIREVPGSNVGL
jgi:hypothetical protein